MFFKKLTLFVLIVAMSLVVGACSTDDMVSNEPYNIAGNINAEDLEGNQTQDINVKISGPGIEDETVVTDEAGNWSATGVEGVVTVTPVKEGNSFEPTSREVSSAQDDLDFVRQGRVAQPTVSLDSGSYLGVQEISLNYYNEYTIYYTLDGSEPTADSTEYTEPITIESDTTLKAIAIDAGGDTSEIATREYEIVSPKAKFKFEEDLTDSTGNFADGSSTGDTPDKTDSGNITFDAGIAGQAAIFDGNSGIRLPDGLIDSYSYTVSLWVKPEQLPDFASIFYGKGNEWISLTTNHINFGGTAFWTDPGVSDFWVDPGESIPTGEWSHIVFTVDQGDFKLYFDGQEKA
ncbi:MAG: chitobiase/beta-hexosaminidase C-terminal domain-containing protein, partial [Bacillota bacterium]